MFISNEVDRISCVLHQKNSAESGDTPIQVKILLDRGM